MSPVADLGGGGGGGQGVATPPPPPQKRSEPYIQNALLILCLACIVVVVSSEHFVKPRSRQAVVKSEVLHLLECQLLELYYKLGQLKWVWF